MNKAFILFATVLLFAIDMQAQAPKIVLVEHFTNTVCSRCPPGNARLFSALDSIGDDALHISYHSRIPYRSCIFYQHNMTQADARRDQYNVITTPYAMLNGTFNGVGSSMLTQNEATNAAQGGSPVGVEVQSRWLPGDSLEVGVNVHFVQELPAGDYALFVALVEERVSYNAPNGETEHHNVFRAMIPGDNGETLPSLSAGMSTGFYSWKIAKRNEWDRSMIKAVAFVQNTSTDEVINAGTDGSFTTSISSGIDPGIRLAPNPATNRIQVSWSAQEIPQATVSIVDLQGRVLYSAEETGASTTIELNDFAAGMYMLQLSAGNQTWSKKMIVQ